MSCLSYLRPFWERFVVLSVVSTAVRTLLLFHSEKSYWMILIGLNIYHIWTKQRKIKSILNSSAGGIGYNIYIRLFILSGIDLFLALPFNLWYLSTWFPLLPWPGWSFVHADWSYILRIPTSQSSLILKYNFMRWINVAYGIAFLMVFAGGAEARERYGSAWKRISKIFSCESGSSQKPCKNLHISFTENQHSAFDESDTSVSSSYTIGENIVTASTVSDMLSKGERESYVGYTAELPKPSESPGSKQRYHTTRIPPPSTSPDLEFGIGMHPPGLKDSKLNWSAII